MNLPVAFLLLAALLAGAQASAQVRAHQAATQANPLDATGARSPRTSGPDWHEISPAQQQALRPLQGNWHTIDAQGKKRWLAVASRFEQMSPQERGLVQQRMSDWARLSPKERQEARLNFSDAQHLAPDQRRERWEAYKALPEDERRTLGARAVPASPERRAPVDGAKNNTVPNPLLEARRPGVTTSPATTRPAPPLHQQPGLPKVAATPEFVNSQTLLPRRGAQGAAAGSPDRAASQPAAQPE